MKTQKPIILISSSQEASPKGGDLTCVSVDSSYVKAIVSAGGNPLIVPCGVSLEDALEFVSVADGLLLPGGVDVNPLRYGEDQDISTNNVSDIRDGLEFALVKSFLEKKKPIFGICRGAQVLNVAMGGNLYRDIKSEIQNPIKHEEEEGVSIAEQYRQDSHTIEIEGGSALFEYFKMKKSTVNSLHHQAVKKVADGIVVGARAEDGIIEEVESVDMKDRWLLGIQWHPEAVLDRHPENKTLFEHFIDATKR